MATGVCVVITARFYNPSNFLGGWKLRLKRGSGGETRRKKILQLPERYQPAGYSYGVDFYARGRESFANSI